MNVIFQFLEFLDFLESLRKIWQSYMQYVERIALSPMAHKISSEVDEKDTNFHRNCAGSSTNVNSPDKRYINEEVDAQRSIHSPVSDTLSFSPPMIEDDEDDIFCARYKRYRKARAFFQPHHLLVLEGFYKRKSYLSTHDREILAIQLGLSEDRVSMLQIYIFSFLQTL